MNQLSIESSKNLRILLTLFTIGILIIVYIIKSFPELNEIEKKNLLQIPKTPNRLKDFVKTLISISETHYYQVLVLFITIYLL